MRKVGIFFVAIAVLSFSSSALASLWHGVPDMPEGLVSSHVLLVETWIKIGEERQVFNKNTDAGIVRRYYADPSQHNGIGSTMSVFRKNGSEEMFWKGWNLYTDNATYAVKFKGSFYLQPRTGPITSNMMTLSALADYIKKSAEPLSPYTDAYGNLAHVPNLGLCLIDENNDYLKTYKGEKVCYKVDFTKNK